MKRTVINYFVDVAIGIAFLMAAVSSIIFLLPGSWVAVTSSGQTSLLGVDMATWSSLHKWSGIAMIGGVVVHTLLHTRWIACMTRRIFGRRSEAKPRVARGLAVPSERAGLPAAVPLQRAGSSRRDTATGRPTGRHRHRGDNAPDGSRRYTRKAFLGAAATVVAGAAVAGVALRGGGSDVAVEESAAPSGQSAAESSAQSAAGTTQDTTGQAAQSQSVDGAAQSGSAAQASGTQQAAARVVVDDGRCTACGHCLQTCPQGVFAFDSGSGTVVAASPGHCTLCGRCIQVCRPQAITLNV